MSLFDTINSDIKKAMLAREKEKLEALRAIKSAILLAKTEKGGTTELSEQDELKLLQKLVKQRNDSADIYNKENRKELAEKELFEAAIIKGYLPEQMSEAEIVEAVKNILKEVNAQSAKDFGKVMGMAAKKLAGKADNKMVSGIIKDLLNE